MRITLASATFLGALLLSAPALGADLFTARVVGVSDGDTITVLDDTKKQHKVRLSGIDAPEKGQAYGERARQNLAELVFDRKVRIEARKTDRYGRLVSVVWDGSRDICLRQLEDGMAWHFKEYEREQPPEERVSYAWAEERARAARRGLWHDQKPIPPWDWRHKQRTKERGEWQRSPN